MTSVKLINHSSSTADWNKLTVRMEPANFPEIYTGNGDESDRM